MVASGLVRHTGRAVFVFAGVMLGGLAVAGAASAAEITVRIDRLKALDKIDSGLAGQADFYARVTIAGEQFTSKIARGKDDVRPQWVFKKTVPPGKHDVKIEVYDRDPLKPDEYIDINRVDKKRDLDFSVDTRGCKISGFSSSERCGRTVVRAGQERKKAQIWFRVNAR